MFEFGRRQAVAAATGRCRLARSKFEFRASQKNTRERPSHSTTSSRSIKQTSSWLGFALGLGAAAQTRRWAAAPLALHS